jgi:hypothetical protein
VQKLFAANRPDQTLPVSLPASTNTVPSLFVAAGLAQNSSDVILKAINRSGQPETLNIKVSGQTAAYGECET